MDRWKAELGRGREKRRVEERRSEKRKSQKKEDAQKGRKVAKHCVFPMIWGSGGSKSRLAKAAGAEPAGQMRDEKLHAVVARSTFRSQNVQNTPCSDHFWKLRCWKIARRCGAKHISKSKCTKHTMLGPFLEVEMSKKCTPLWCEAHFEVKMYKTHHCRTAFGSWDVEKVHAVVVRSTFRSQNVQSTPRSDHFWTFRCRFAWQAQGIVHLSKVTKTWGFCSIFNYNHHYTTLHPNTLQLHLHYIPLHYTLHYTPLHNTTLNYTQLHSITLNYTTLHYTTIHYTTLHSLHYTILHHTTFHYTTLHYTTLQLHNYTPLHSTTLNYTTLYYTTVHYTTLLSTTLHYTTLHYTTLHYIPPHCSTLHYTPLHYTNYNYNYNYNNYCIYTTLHALHYTEWHCTTDRQVDRQIDR